jgi:hypothetical protein
LAIGLWKLKMPIAVSIPIRNAGEAGGHGNPPVARIRVISVAKNENKKSPPPAGWPVTGWVGRGLGKRGFPRKVSRRQGHVSNHNCTPAMRYFLIKLNQRATVWRYHAAVPSFTRDSGELSAGFRRRRL